MEVIGKNKLFPSFRDFVNMLVTFGLTVIAWVFFRAENVTHAWQIVTEIFSKSLLTIPSERPYITIILIFIFIVFEWFGRDNEYAIERLGFKWKMPLRWFVYYLLFITIIYFSFANSKQEFIYFQF
jgi:DMSO/TMAO reductase YedYZ heme-binding membrane subunit